MKKARAWLLALGCALLAVLSGVQYASQRSRAAPVDAFVRKFGLDVRWPGLLEQTRFEPSPDFAASVVADTVVREETGSVAWSELSAEQRAAWLASFAGRDEELTEAIALMSQAMAANPGWAFHRFFAGQLAYLRERRKGGGVGSRPEVWLVPLGQAVAMAPGLDSPAGFLAEAIVDNWKVLGERDKKDVRKLLARAFLDQGFLAWKFGQTVNVLGRDEALSLVPDEPVALTVALAEMARIGDVPAAAKVVGTWEAAEMKSRRADLAKLERRAEMGDVDGVRDGCRAWAAAHRVLDFDTTGTRKQMARVLDLWPDDVRGTWRGDPRGEMVRYFLDGRAGDVLPAAMSRAVGALTGVPESIAARVAHLVSDRYAMEGAIRSSDGAGSLEWTPFFVEKARAELREGHPDEALRTLGSVASAARGECAVLLTRRDVAAALGDPAGRDEANQLLRTSQRPPVGLDSVSPTGAISLCVDPAVDASGFLDVEVEAPAGTPALVEWAGNQARWGDRLVEGKAVIRFPLAGLQGRSTFATGALVGRVVVTRVERTEGRTAASSSRSGEAMDAATEAPRTAARAAGVAGSEKLNSTRP